MSRRRPQDIGPISIDFETYDPNLSDFGTDAYSCCRGGFPFSLAIWTPDPQYQFVVRREEPEWEPTIRWLAQGMREGGCHFIGANIKYELGWLHWLEAWGTPDTPATAVLAQNRWSDVLVRAALIDATDRKKLHLEGQANLYRLAPKGTEALYAEAIKMGLGTEKRPPKKQTVYENLWKMPADIVSEYNLLDAQLAYEIYHRQTPILEAEGLEKVAEMEERLTPVLAAMESKGLRIDLEALDRLEEDLTRRIRATQERVDRQAGEPVSPNPSHSLARALAHIPLPKTATGKPKTDAKTLKRYIDAAPIVGDILDLRRLSKILGTFVQGAIRENLSGDRIYCTLNQLASDSYGVVYGRLSCSNPNGQQIPKRDEEFGPLMRGLFIPEPGFQFLAADYSKQEPRMSAHLAVTWNVPGAKAIADAFKANPDLDVHSYVASLANLTGILGDKLGYLAGKTMNLAISYGQQEKSTQASLLALGVPEEVLSQVTAAYHQAYPHVRGCMELFQRIAEKNGFVRTILGRKQRFDGWVPRGYVNHGPKDKNGRPAPLPWEEAKAVYRVEELGLVLVRAKTYAAFNYANQGSAADQTKMAMNALFYDHGIVPNLQVHDELIDGEGTPEKAEIYKKVMEEVVELAVPVRVEVTLGASWAG